MPRFTPLAVGVGLILGLSALMTSDALADSKLLARGRAEQPGFTLLERGEGFELRRYNARLVAEVELTGDSRTASEAGFRLLAGFIFGGNTRAEKVAMTSPVDMRTTSEPAKCQGSGVLIASRSAELIALADLVSLSCSRPTSEALEVGRTDRRSASG